MRQRAFRTRHNRRGMSLLELLVAMAILAVGIVGVLHAFSSSIAASKASETYSVGAMLAHQAASELERRAGDLKAGQYSGTFSTEPRYSWKADVAEPGQDGIVPVKVVVYWLDAGKGRRFELLTSLRPPAEESETDGETDGSTPPEMPAPDASGGL